jgi:hypothetical protein
LWLAGPDRNGPPDDEPQKDGRDGGTA